MSNDPTPQADDRAESGVPSFDEVREQIENRFSTALGSTELAGGTPQAQAFEDKFTERERSAQDKLEEIRRSMRAE